MMNESLFDEAAESIRQIHIPNRSVLVAIDGRCGSGKSTLAQALSERFGYAVIHMDDFFLRPEQRTPERLAKPGGNVDYERFLTEVLLSLYRGKLVEYRKYQCSTGLLSSPVELKKADVTVIEGSYSLHPMLRSYYDYRIFMTTDPQTQLNRIALRSGADKLEAFRTRWIPLEELYISALKPESCSDMILET